MIPNVHPVYQAILGTIVTWGLTALGSAMVFCIDVKDQKRSQKVLDAMLGFAAGVMIAASYWSLLAPAIEIASESELYGPNGRYAFVPAAVGFGLGAACMHYTEGILEYFMDNKPQDYGKKFDDPYDVTVPRKKHVHRKDSNEVGKKIDPLASYGVAKSNDSFRRVVLLVIAITVHNFPEGMAVGVGFGSIGQSETASFSNAFNLAIGIGLQNFPEGLAVSMPLRREGMSAMKAFMWGQLSGIVEPIGGILGAAAVMYVQPILPYALSFAAGCMIFVVVDDLIPEASGSGNQRLATLGTIVGFVVMMTMDVALG